MALFCGTSEPLRPRALSGRAGLRQAGARPPTSGETMPVLDQLVSAIRSSAIEVVDLTARLEAATPVIQLPEPFANTVSFSLREVSRYDERGPAWYWNDITTGEHTGTHFDAPVHWITGRNREDVSQ